MESLTSSYGLQDIRTATALHNLAGTNHLLHLAKSPSCKSIHLSWETLQNPMMCGMRVMLDAL